MLASDFMLRLWLMDMTQFSTTSVALQTTYQQVLPADPMRAALLLGGNTTQSTWYAFLDQQPTYAQGPIAYATGQQPLIITFDQMGSVMRLPLWGKAAVNGSNGVVISVSFDPIRYQQAMRWFNAHISQYGSP